MEERSYRATKKLLVAVTTELTGKGAGLIAEGKEGGLNVMVLEGFKAERPVVACGAIDEDECEFVPADRDAVAESNINVYNVEISSREPIDRFATGCLWNCCISAEG